MPIHLNLLAEAQAAEEMRRRDPVKRAIWVAVLLVSLMLVWSSSLQLKAMLANNDVSRVESQMASRTNEYKIVLDSEKKLEEINHNIGALEQLQTNRFLHATLLNAMQQTDVEDVQLTHLRTEQTYALVEEVKPRTNDTRVVLGRPATATERIVIVLAGSDSAPNPGDRVPKYKELVSNQPYFRQMLGRTNVFTLKNLSQPQFLPNSSTGLGKSCVLFELECRFPDKTR